jgi:hypothetical protein
MDFVAAGLSSLLTLFTLALFIAGVLKLFQIHAVLIEIKDGLASKGGLPVGTQAVRSVLASDVPSALHEMGSGDDMLRALDAQMKWDQNANRSETTESR